MGAVSNAVTWAVGIANDNSHGYDQTNRWGPDYDCSSLVISAYENAGVPVKTNGATYTGNMVSVFLACGFIDVTSRVNLTTGSGLIKGDVVWKTGHVEMVTEPGYLVGASANENGEATGGATGDQNAKEIRVRAYYNGPWTTVLRWPETYTYITGNRYLSQAEMETNARYIWNYLGSRGWSRNAVAGMLGNMQTESTINPGIWQGLNDGVGPAYGLVQWDPYTKYTTWCAENGLDPAHMDSALKRIEYELENGLQYYPTPSYPETFAEFKTSTASPYYLGMAFLANYERPKNPDQPARGTQAEKWYTFLGGIEPDTPDTPAPWTPRKRMSLLLLLASRRRI